MDVVAAAQGLSIGYRKKTVIQDLSFEIRSGTTAVLGPNGAGKSTLLRTLATVHPVLNGRLEILGKSAEAKNVNSIRSMTSFLPQSAAFQPHFTVAQHLRYSCWLKGIRNDIESSISSAVELFELQDIYTQKLRRLSGGQLKRHARRSARHLSIAADS